jgi:hypothetical protein
MREVPDFAKPSYTEIQNLCFETHQKNKSGGIVDYTISFRNMTKQETEKTSSKLISRFGPTSRIANDHFFLLHLNMQRTSTMSTISTFAYFVERSLI